MILPPLAPGSLLFAPMEGVTDALWRETVVDTCPNWDVLACDFLRVPSAGRYPSKHLIAHIGARFLNDPDWNARTMFQILAAERSHTEDIARQLHALGVKWVDLNLGCPSNTVCKSGGGSFLLKDHALLARIVRDVRKNFPGRFTCKIRVGWGDGSKLDDIVHLLNDEGAEMITVHGRTREQMYKEPANWNWIAQAVRASQVPVIGNGDVWRPADARRMMQETGCHSVMVARGALRTPWFPALFHGEFQETPEAHRQMALMFIRLYWAKLVERGIREESLAKQMKSITRFMFEAYPDGESWRRKVLLSQTPAAIEEVLHQWENLSIG